MQFAIDARELEGEATGVGRVLAGLLEAWPEGDDLTLYARDQPSLPSGLACRLRRLRAPGWFPGALWEQTVLPAVLRADRPAALLSPAYGMPRLLSCPAVVIMHDCACYQLPAEFGSRERWRRRASARVAGRHAAFLVVPSEFSAREACRWLGTDRERVKVVPWGLTNGFGPVTDNRLANVRRRYDLPDRFVLFVGALLPRRDLTLIADVVASLGRTRADLHLCVAGTRPAVGDQVISLETAGLGRRLRWLGYLPEQDLPALYAAATVSVYPSTYEGFGLPVLEALACGTPVVTTEATALAERYRGRAWLVPNNDRLAWLQALGTLIDDSQQRRDWIDRGQEWACQHDWGSAAAVVRQLLAQAALSQAGS